MYSSEGSHEARNNDTKASKNNIYNKKRYRGDWNVAGRAAASSAKAPVWFLVTGSCVGLVAGSRPTKSKTSVALSFSVPRFQLVCLVGGCDNGWRVGDPWVDIPCPIQHIKHNK